MLVLTGIFENERFIPDRPISIPQGQRVTVTIDDGINTKQELEAGYKAMANDEEYEKEAMEWCNGLMNGIDNETR